MHGMTLVGLSLALRRHPLPFHDTRCCNDCYRKGLRLLGDAALKSRVLGCPEAGLEQEDLAG